MRGHSEVALASESKLHVSLFPQEKVSASAAAAGVRDRLVDDEGGIGQNEVNRESNSIVGMKEGREEEVQSTSVTVTIGYSDIFLDPRRTFIY